MIIPSISELKRYLKVKDVIFSLVPTGGTYAGYANFYTVFFPKDWSMNVYMGLGISILVFILILGILCLINIEEHKKTLAEILAVGYYRQFIEEMGKKLSLNNKIKFIFPEEEVIAETSNVRLEIIMPESLEELNRLCKNIEANTKIVYINSDPYNHPSWVRAVKNGQMINIYDYPRTLFSLGKYIEREYDNDTSKKLHAAFISFINNRWSINQQEIPDSMIKRCGDRI